MRINFGKQIGTAALALALCGCFFTAQNAVAPGVENETRVAYGTSTVSNPDFSREFSVKPAPALIGKADCEACVRYAENGLIALGMTRVEAGKAGALTVTVDYAVNTGEKRPRYDFAMRGMIGSAEALQVKTYCFGDADKAANYLPGLVAGALPLVGANRPAAAINLKFYNSYLEAVMGETPEPAETAADKPAQAEAK